ncbi:NAD(P)/FAD-dependent oxidoreductase [Nostoc sp. C117]|uniref:NAD(P)/FAD-dependent oxidoreductase n=1 Tax=Nostoc sp. C117 TaxID=3349875 RepID=UPI00370DC369
MNSRRVVIVGAGFGGLQAAQSLANCGADVLLIDRHNYHTFVPLLYQVATGQLEPEYIAYPIRTILRPFSFWGNKPKVQFLMAEVEQIDFSGQTVETDSCSITYDFLVLATGSRTQFLRVPGASESAFSMRTLEEAIAIRNQIFSCFEQAIKESDSLRRQQLLTFTIVGGGATGVEVVGAFVEMVRGQLRRDYPTLVKEVRLILMQSGDRLLAELPKKLGAYTHKRLHQLGVEVYLQTRVTRVTFESVHLQNHEVIPTATVIWTAGLEANYPTTSKEVSFANKGKLLVHPTLQLLEQPNVYAVGDLAYVVEKNGKSLTGVAPEALQQGVAVARNIQRQFRGQLPKPFSYFDKGRLAIIGCYSGVGKIGAFAFTGCLAWLMWLGVHLVYLPGYRSRLLVLLTWLHTYLLRDRSVRLILSVKKR